MTVEYFGVENLRKTVETIDAPDDLKEVLRRYVEMYAMANDVHQSLRSNWFQLESGGLSLRFDTDGDVAGDVAMNLIARLWRDDKLTIDELALLYSARYVGPSMLLIEERAVKGVDFIDGLLAPLREAGWEASVTSSWKDYQVEATLTYAALMRDAEVS